MKSVFFDLAFGFHSPDHWIGRYTRFRVTLPSGRHCLIGQFYSPPLTGGSNNRVLFALHDRQLEEVTVLPDEGWQSFEIPLPTVADNTTIYVMLRTTRFFRPPPDERILGVMLKDFAVQVDD